MASKNTVLLMAYGGAQNVDELPAFLRHIRSHYSKMTGAGEPTDEEYADLTRRYRLIGGFSPILKITSSLTQKLGSHLRALGYDIDVLYGMKHSKPFIEEVFDRVLDDGAENVLGLVLAPHYSMMSVRGYHQALIDANKKRGEKARLTLIYSWHLNQKYIEKLAERVERAKAKYFAGQDKTYYMFTAHSLPQKILEWGDPYPKQLQETTEALAAKLGLKPGTYGFAYQSASSHGEPWLGPSTEEELERLKAEGWSNVLVAPIGFVCDHLEILYDIDIELKQKAKKLGVRLERIESFNDSQDFVETLTSVIEESSFIEHIRR